jgi:hypothetical protein
LTLTVDCDGTTTSTSGASGQSLMALGSSCQVSLSGPSNVIETSYTLSLGAP